MTITEKQKMIRGEVYNPRDEELVQDRRTNMLRLIEFNTSTDDEERLKLARKIFGSFGEGTFINPTFRCDYGYQIFIGNNVEINYDCCFLDIARITIGNNVFFGPNVHLYTVNHPLDPTERRKGVEIPKAITIGDDCWIGGCVVVCPGVTIGKGVTIGAGSVVTRDIPDYSLAVGSPAKPKQIKDIKEFLEIARRKDAKSARVKKNADNVKFKVRCSRYLYTLVVKDKSKANKLRQSLPPALVVQEI
ncbi:hypothetical protein G6F64_001885 [Rhizopus arrhizus]|uniref:Maltose/galactoside acetyltransferase domain-containing protein n=1 Tax=Rhizopus oryzae TaxID=64495 RepID=A0A9P7BVX6_RHIOR|nr:hypothetical protein G6F64_001885 [Rhizopus arrhizus]